jgi:hypothetical protein
VEPLTDQTVMSPFWSLSVVEGDNWKLAPGAVEACRSGSMLGPIGDQGFFLWKLRIGTCTGNRRRGRRKRASDLANSEVDQVLYWTTPVLALNWMHKIAVNRDNQAILILDRSIREDRQSQSLSDIFRFVSFCTFNHDPDPDPDMQLRFYAPTWTQKGPTSEPIYMETVIGLLKLQLTTFNRGSNRSSRVGFRFGQVGSVWSS